MCTPDPEFDNIFIRCTDLSLLFVFVLNGKLMIGVVDVHGFPITFSPGFLLIRTIPLNVFVT